MPETWRHHLPRPDATDRLAQKDGTAKRIRSVDINNQLEYAGDRLGGKGFIQLNLNGIIHGHFRLTPGPFDGGHRAEPI